MLTKSWSFRIASVAFIVLITPAMAFYLRGMAGFLVLIGMAVIAGMMEKTLGISIRLFIDGLSKNKWFTLFLVWYIFGLIINSFSRGRGFDDWRWILPPTIIFIGMWFMFSFLRDPACFRQFQIGLILALGVQGIFATIEFLGSAGIARLMWYENMLTGWVYGNQSFFALFAVLLPMFVGRAFKETGLLRFTLLASCSAILISVSVSSFATPLGLIGIGILLVIGLMLAFLFRKRMIVIILALTITALLGYLLTYQNSLFFDAYSRIGNLLNDPTSGGYVNSTESSSRWYLGMHSLESFMAEPFFGMGGGITRYSKYVGGHSSLLDGLGAYGLLGGGGALAAMMLTLIFKALVYFLRERNMENLLALTSTILLFVAGVVNPYWEGIEPLSLVLMSRFFIVSPLRSIQVSSLVAPLHPRVGLQAR